MILFFGVYFAQDVNAQVAVTDLHDEMDARRVSLISTAGNGNSSGMVITGYLRNDGPIEKRININLTRPIYLVNAGRGQNMVGVQVFLRGGAYSSLGRQSFIRLPAGSQTPVVFVAFCVDFDLDNPTESSRFSVGTVPPAIRRTLLNILIHTSANPDEDIVSAGQAAIWLVQGVSIERIRARFPVSYAEEALARKFIR